MWYTNPKLTAEDAREMGLINRVVPDEKLEEATRDYALEVAARGSVALASLKASFNARHGGVGGLARLAHDLLLRQYLNSEEAEELSAAFSEKRSPNTDKFGH